MFDPLHKWLGIPPSEQPPNHYRLLGISLFESDPEVIDAAADKHLSYLHEFANGEHSALSEDLSNRIAKARLQLLSPDRKEAYDKSLRRKQKRDDQKSLEQKHASAKPPGPATANADQPISNANSWHLRHDSQTQHGPFTLTALIEAAREGKITSQTELHHVNATGNDWIPAISVPVIAQYCVKGSVNSQNPSLPSQTPSKGASPLSDKSFSVRTQTAQPSDPLALVKTLAQVFIPTLVFAIPIYFVASKSELFSRWTEADKKKVVAAPIQQSTPNHSPADADIPSNDFQPAPSVNEPLETSQEPIPPRVEKPHTIVAVVEEMSPPTIIETDSRAEDTATASSAVNKPVLRDQFDPAEFTGLTPTQPIVPDETGRMVELKIELDSSTWYTDIPGIDETYQVRVDSMTEIPTKIQLTPESGELSFDSTTRVTLDPVSGLAIDLRLEKPENHESIAIKGKWVCRVEGTKEGPFSIRRLEKFMAPMSNQINLYNKQLSLLTKEQTDLTAFLEPNEFKTPEMLANARQRLRLVNTQLTRLQSQNQNVVLLDNIKKRVIILHEKGNLVLHCVPSSIPSVVVDTDTIDVAPTEIPEP
ncbi:hypothetical protein CA13_04550 [Planctomycetes bacterium CA13]|uniref:GYF domain-containing protein n=1 Tax=Novipirellula herctigrandis TaxID=2527986 RepID=A0A5C5YVK8_9BACT|nr:hypothetical protein CA13_04550 [Planctomycetes bacterium CA13]